MTKMNLNIPLIEKTKILSKVDLILPFLTFDIKQLSMRHACSFFLMKVIRDSQAVNIPKIHVQILAITTTKNSQRLKDFKYLYLYSIFVYMKISIYAVKVVIAGQDSVC